MAKPGNISPTGGVWDAGSAHRWWFPGTWQEHWQHSGPAVGHWPARHPHEGQEGFLLSQGMGCAMWSVFSCHVTGAEGLVFAAGNTFCCFLLLFVIYPWFTWVISVNDCDRAHYLTLEEFLKQHHG